MFPLKGGAESVCGWRRENSFNRELPAWKVLIGCAIR